MSVFSPTCTIGQARQGGKVIPQGVREARPGGACVLCEARQEKALFIGLQMGAPGPCAAWASAQRGAPCAATVYRIRRAEKTSPPPATVG